eukprot:4162285-Amphidinium_carterae.1
MIALVEVPVCPRKCAKQSTTCMTGTFYAPVKILIDTSLCRTLPQAELFSGCTPRRKFCLAKLEAPCH